MSIIIILNINNKSIRLTSKQWKHIVYRHPEICNKINEIESTLKFPDYIKKEENIQKYYKYLKEEAKYMMIAVKILNGDGFVITAYTTRKIQR